MSAERIIYYNVTSWREAVDLCRLVPRGTIEHWVFRGQGSADWPLLSTLDRDAIRFDCDRKQLAARFNVLLTSFWERAHLYDDKIPRNPKDWPASTWYSVLRHHGGPAHLLDFTRSFYIAAFFAMRDAPRKRDAAVWALNFEKLASIAHTPKQLHLVDPPFAHARAVTQQSVLVLCSDAKDTFEESLCRGLVGTASRLDDLEHFDALSADRAVEALTDAAVMKITLPYPIHRDALYDLSRMNITSASLFLTLDGLADSVRIHLRYPTDSDTPTST